MKNYHLYHVVAVSRGNVIGKNSQLPWHFKSDLKHFKELTLNNTVIMGRKTFESIGKPLPERENFVLSRDRPHSDEAHHLYFFSTLEDALSHVKTPKAFIIGGASLYKQTIQQVDGIYLTRIEEQYEGDTFYPTIPPAFQVKDIAVLQSQPKIEVIYLENTALMAAHR